MTNLHSNTIEAFTIFVMIMISIMVISKQMLTKINLHSFLVHKRPELLETSKIQNRDFYVH